MTTSLVIVLTGVLIAIACALPGSFLILRRMSMLADAISHAVLPGLVAGYALAQGPNLLTGAAGAVAAALLTVVLVQALERTQRVSADGAIGIVFPALFALGTAIVSRFYADVHIDADAILYGNIEFAALDRLLVGSADLGPSAVWTSGVLVALNLGAILVTYKELKISTFDPGLSASLGYSPSLLHYGLMTLVAITSVGAFTAVGAVLTVALFIVPAATAFLLTQRLPVMLALAATTGALAAVLGYGLAVALDASVAGAIAASAGLLFLLAYLFSPYQGVLAHRRQQQRQRLQFAQDTLILHLITHEGTDRSGQESAVAHLRQELRWAPSFADQVVRRVVERGLVARTNGHLALTAQGRIQAQELLRLEQLQTL